MRQTPTFKTITEVVPIYHIAIEKAMFHQAVTNACGIKACLNYIKNYGNMFITSEILLFYTIKRQAIFP